MMSKVAGSSFGMCARSRGRPRSRQSSSASCITDIIPSPSRSTFTMPRSSQSSLSHWATTRPGMEAFSNGTNELSLFWQMIMPPEAVNRVIEPDERRHPRMILRQTSLLDLRFQFHRVREIAVCEQMREAIDGARRKIQRLADFARGAASAIADHVCGHRSAVFAVAPINFLDHRLAAIATGKIEIDVWPTFAALVKESLEDEMTFDRINRCDP